MDKTVAAMTERGRVLVLLVLIFSFSWAIAGCGNDAKPEPAEPQKAVSMESPEMDEEYSAGASAGEDLGIDCETHEYILGPGDEVSLEFQIRLNYSDLTVAGLPQKLIPEDEVKIKSDDDYWKKTGGKVELSDFRLEEMPRSVPTWGVDSPELAEAQRQGKKVLVITQSGTQGANFRVSFGNDGIGMFRWLGPAKKPSEVADLSQEEVADLLGSDMTISGYKGENLPHQLDVTEIYADRTDYYLNLSFEVRMPEKTKKNLGCKSYHRIYAKGFGTLASFQITYTFDGQRDGLYHVSGPAVASYCEP